MIIKTIEIKLSGKELADELWELDCQEQADFFNKNGFVKDNFNHGYASIQIDRITELLDENGRKFIEKLYESMQGWADEEILKAAKAWNEGRDDEEMLKAVKAWNERG